MNKKYTLIPLLLFIVLVFLLGSCSGGGGGSTYTPIPPPSPPPATTGTLGLHNNSSVTLDYFYLSPTSQFLWGPNQLLLPLNSGIYQEIVNVPPDTYDAKVTTVGIYSTYYCYLSNFPITAGNTFHLDVYNSSFTGSMKVVNDTIGAYIIGLYIVPSTYITWGFNQISSSIGPLGYYHMIDMPPGNYAVKVVWDIGPDSIYLFNNVSSLTLTTLFVT